MASPPKSRAKAVAAGLAAAGRRAGVWPGWLDAFSEKTGKVLASWAAAEVAPGRLLPWLPVAFGCGIAAYFAADREPAWWAASSLPAAMLAIAFAARKHPFGFPLALGLAAFAAGFAIATLNTVRIDHPILRSATWSAEVSGFVEVREERAKSDRIVVRVHKFEAPRLSEKPQRVRVSVRKGTAPAVGTFVAFKAYLAPPLEPLRPGGYDFARDLYFQQIGASGYVLGRIRHEAAPVKRGLWLSYATFFDGLRDSMDNRIRAILPGDRGSIASALITGTRDAISPAVNDAMYVSSLAHVLSISGYHMAVVAGMVFFAIRAVLALFPALALTRPIKKWAALGALGAATFYLMLSGAEVATQRSYIMVAIVLIGVMADRPAITFRTLTIAALIVMALTPQTLVHPSFQMSFAATLALVAGYQTSLRWQASADSPIAARIALWGGREAATLILASLVAGLATTPYAAFHFHRVAPYGVIANLLAMPVVSVVVMPMGIAGALTMPFGFDAVFWKLMGLGLDWMIAVALWVTQLPGAVGPMPAFGVAPLLLVTLGLLLLCLLRSPLRWSGGACVVVAAIWAVATPQPDVLIAGDGQTAAVRGASGNLVYLQRGRDSFAVKEWLSADGDTRATDSASLKEGLRCDAIGCTASLRDGRVVAFASSVEAFAEDCARAAVVLSSRTVPGACQATLIDRAAWQRHGAAALYVNGEGFDVVVARPATQDRPWARVRPAPVADASTQNIRRNAPDATPRTEDLEADGP
ncbi:MAG TPA: ComEC/Rec2 family competence protein [Pseudolabrys sp.]|nr:ComEC/Rec2 family competence protein [Pseudolabrys sp.]